MLSRVLPHFIRRFAVLLLALLLGLGALGPALAQVTIFSPFNIADAMDQGVKKTADIRYREGNRGKLDIYTPEKSDGLAPVVMFIYGGAWAAGDKFEYEFVGRALAANGYVAVIADYRLFPEVRYPDFLEDCAAAAHWIEENIVNYGGDTRRFFLAGHSAGAYNAVMLGLDASFFRDQGVSMPIRAVAAISGPFNFYPFEYDQVRVIFGDAPNPEGTQPINLVAAGDPPIFLGSGTTDPIVRVENSRALAEKLRAQGVWVTEKYYEGFGHLEPIVSMGAMMRFRMPILQDMLNFFQTFGAFPSGTPRPVFTPSPPEDQMTNVIKQMDLILQPISDGRRNE
jgi:acetyl esterase/lipase